MIGPKMVKIAENVSFQEAQEASMNAYDAGDRHTYFTAHVPANRVARMFRFLLPPAHPVTYDAFGTEGFGG